MACCVVLCCVVCTRLFSHFTQLFSRWCCHFCVRVRECGWFNEGISCATLMTSQFQTALDDGTLPVREVLTCLVRRHPGTVYTSLCMCVCVSWQSPTYWLLHIPNPCPHSSGLVGPASRPRQAYRRRCARLHLLAVRDRSRDVRVLSPVPRGRTLFNIEVFKQISYQTLKQRRDDGELVSVHVRAWVRTSLFTRIDGDDSG